jgi:hypothetical protein
MVRAIAVKIEERLLQGVLNVSGSDDEGEVRVIEHPEHPFLSGRYSCRKRSLCLTNRIRWLLLL